MDGDPLKTYTNHIGFRAEYDLAWALQCDPNSAVTVGLGTRFWNRSVQDGTTDSGIPVQGYDETWWALYPCVGLETRGPLGCFGQWFGSATLGVTAFTYEHVPVFSVELVSQARPLGTSGTRHPVQAILLSGFFQLMQFYASNVTGNGDYFQPDSLMLIAGISGGVRF